jgi:hypothetical protein
MHGTIPPGVLKLDLIYRTNDLLWLKEAGNVPNRKVAFKFLPDFFINSARLRSGLFVRHNHSVEYTFERLRWIFSETSARFRPLERTSVMWEDRMGNLHLRSRQPLRGNSSRIWLPISSMRVWM